jgi:hypothetical protein
MGMALTGRGVGRLAAAYRGCPRAHAAALTGLALFWSLASAEGTGSAGALPAHLGRQAGVTTRTGDEAGSRSATRGTRTSALDIGDPLSAATGEYFFALELVDLGGVLPLALRFY